MRRRRSRRSGTARSSPCSPSSRTSTTCPTYGLGLIAGTSFLAGLGAQVGLARYADRGYTRLLLRVGLAVAAAGMLWFGLASQLWEFIGARLLLGLGSGMFVPAARRVVVARSGAKSGEALGRLASVEVAGFISGPPIAALLAALFGSARAVPLPRGRARAHVARRSRGSTSRRSVSCRPSARCGCSSPTAGCGPASHSRPRSTSRSACSTRPWARYMTDLGASTTVIAVTLALFALPLVALSPFGGRLADRRGPVRSGVIALTFTVPLIAGYGISNSVLAASLIARHPLGVRRGVDALRPGDGGAGGPAVADRRGPGSVRPRPRPRPRAWPRSVPRRSTARPAPRRCGVRPRAASRCSPRWRSTGVAARPPTAPPSRRPNRSPASFPRHGNLRRTGRHRHRRGPRHRSRVTRWSSAGRAPRSW